MTDTKLSPIVKKGLLNILLYDVCFLAKAFVFLNIPQTALNLIDSSADMNARSLISLLPRLQDPKTLTFLCYFLSKPLEEVWIVFILQAIGQVISFRKILKDIICKIIGHSL